MAAAITPSPAVPVRQSRPQWSYLLRESVLFPGLTYLLMFAGTSGGVVDYPTTRLSLGLLAMAVALWLAVTFWPGRIRIEADHSRRPAGFAFGWLLVAGLALYGLAAVFSLDPRRSLGQLWLVSLYVLLFLLSADLVARRWPRELFVKALLLAGGLIAGLSWFSVITWYRQWLAAAPGHWLPGEVYRLASPNTLAIFLNILLMLAVARLLATRAWVPRLLLALWCLAALGLIFFTSSRGGWLGTATGLATIFGQLLAQRQQRNRLAAVWQRLRMRPALLGGAVILVGAVGLAVGGLAFRQLAHPTHGSVLDARTEFWRPAWSAFAQHPWLGQGPFTYGSAYLRFNSVPPSLAYTHAHSSYFNLLAEAGLAGLAASVLAAIALARLARQSWRDLRGEDRAVLVGAAGALAACAVHGLVDTIGAEPSNSMLLAIVLGAALAPTPAGAAKPAARARPIAVLAAAVLAAGAIGLWLSAPLHAAVVASQQGDWRAAATFLQQAAQRDPRSAIVQQQRGIAESWLAAQGDGTALHAATAAFEVAVQLDPDWALNWANLGSLYAAEGQYLPALDALRAATQRAPLVAQYSLNLGQVAEADGQLAEARSVYSRTLALQPGWADAYFFRATSFRAEVVAQWRLSQAVQSSPTTAELEADLARDPQLAVRYTRLAQAYLEAGQVDKAGHLLARAELAYFNTRAEQLEVRWLRAEVAAAQGQLAIAVGLGQGSLDAYWQQSIFGPGTFGDVAYSAFLFRREATPVDLVRQFSLITLTDPWAVRQVQLGDWVAALGDEERAQALYRQVLEAVPDNAAAQARLR